jgi:hypothetical protein
LHRAARSDHVARSDFMSTVCLDDYDGLDHDAQVLAAFLQRPLWKPR